MYETDEKITSSDKVLELKSIQRTQTKIMKLEVGKKACDENIPKNVRQHNENYSSNMVTHGHPKVGAPGFPKY